MLNQRELDIKAAECILYAWSCCEVSTTHAKRAAKLLGFTIDFRQADIGNEIEAEYLGQLIILEV
jgi:hypothetical protein